MLYITLPCVLKERIQVNKLAPLKHYYNNDIRNNNMSTILFRILLSLPLSLSLLVQGDGSPPLLVHCEDDGQHHVEQDEQDQHHECPEEKHCLQGTRAGHLHYNNNKIESFRKESKTKHATNKKFKQVVSQCKMHTSDSKLVCILLQLRK